jgi:RNA polymerase sigma-70 factor (ECF subfamily)
MSSPSSKRIVGGFNRREPWAVTMIYDIFRAPLYGWIRQMTGNREDTEDIVAAAFSALLEQKNHFDRMSRIRHFLRNSARNACLNLLARREVARSRSDEVGDFYRHLQVDDETAEIMEQYMNRLMASIDALPRRSREIILMLLQRQMTCAEIAQELRISSKTVANRKALAIRRLKLELAGALILIIPLYRLL